MDGQRWFYCFNETIANSKSDENGYVKFREWKGGGFSKNINLPCRPLARFNGGWITPPQEDNDGTLVILDEKDGNKNQTTSKVHTKISGNDYKFRIFNIDNAGKFGSGINSVTCTVTEKNGTSFTGSAAETSFWEAIFGGKGKNFIFGPYSPTSSGEARIECTGTSTNGKALSAKATFFISKMECKRFHITFGAKNTRSGGRIGKY